MDQSCQLILLFSNSNAKIITKFSGKLVITLITATSINIISKFFNQNFPIKTLRLVFYHITCCVVPNSSETIIPSSELFLSVMVNYSPFVAW